MEMKLRNKKTGEIWEFMAIQMDGTPKTNEATRGATSCFASSIAELNEEWEDYDDREIEVSQYGVTVEIKCSSLQESAEIYRKLKAWKRLKDKGFKFEGYGKDTIYFKLDEEYAEYTYDGDLYRLFGGEK